MPRGSVGEIPLRGWVRIGIRVLDMINDKFKAEEVDYAIRGRLEDAIDALQDVRRALPL